MKQASLKQGLRLLKLVEETDWSGAEVQRRLIERWGLLRQIAEALDDPQLSEDQVRAMHPLFYNRSALPTEITLGGHTYEILTFLQYGENLVSGHTMVERAREMQAHLKKEDGEFLLAHQDEIPAILRGRIVFVFTDYCHPDGSEKVAYVDWDDGRWSLIWDWPGVTWFGSRVRFLRRKVQHGENAK